MNNPNNIPVVPLPPQPRFAGLLGDPYQDPLLSQQASEEFNTAHPLPNMSLQEANRLLNEERSKRSRGEPRPDYSNLLPSGFLPEKTSTQPKVPMSAVNKAASMSNEEAMIAAKKGEFGKNIQGYGGYRPDLSGVFEPVRQSAEQDVYNQYQGLLGPIMGQFATSGKAYEDIKKKRGEIASELGVLENETAARKEQIFNSLQEDMAAQQQDIEEKQRIHADHVASINEDIAKARKDYRDSIEIDPNRLIKESGISGLIVSSLAMAAGAFGSALTHGPNYAAEMINKSIDDDMRAQLEKRNGLRDILEETRSQLGEERSRHMGDLEVLQMHKVFAKEKALVQLDAISAAHEGTKAGLIARDTKQILENEQHGKQTELALKVAQLKLAGAELGIKEKSIKSPERDMQRKLAQVGLTGIPLNDDALNKAVAAKTDGEIFNNTARKLRSLMDDAGWQPLPTTKARLAQGMVATMMAQAAKLEKLGVMSKQDYTFMEKQLPSDPTQFRQGVAKAQVDAAIDRATQAVNITIKNSGLKLMDQMDESTLRQPLPPGQ